MKEHLRQLAGVHGPLRGRNVAREYLQARILGALQRAGAMTSLAFHGGTSLRFLFGLPGWSGTKMTPASWRRAVAERLELLDWSRTASDVRPFLERAEDVELVDRETVLRLSR